MVTLLSTRETYFMMHTREKMKFAPIKSEQSSTSKDASVEPSSSFIAKRIMYSQLLKNFDRTSSDRVGREIL